MNNITLTSFEDNSIKFLTFPRNSEPCASDIIRSKNQRKCYSQKDVGFVELNWTI